MSLCMIYIYIRIHMYIYRYTHIYIPGSAYVCVCVLLEARLFGSTSVLRVQGYGVLDPSCLRNCQLAVLESFSPCSVNVQDFGGYTKDEESPPKALNPKTLSLNPGALVFLNPKQSPETLNPKP